MKETALSRLARPLLAGAAYFGIVFGAGVLLGIARVVWIAPEVGVRPAELAEMPVMLAVMLIASRWIVARFAVAPRPSPRLVVGLVALGLVLAAEFAIVLRLRHIPFGQYAAGMDLLIASLYYTLLGVMAVLPLFAPAAALKRPLRAGLVIAMLLLLVPAGLVVERYRQELHLQWLRVASGSRVAETPCGPIEYASRGAGDAVLIVHGAGGGYDQGLALAEALAAGGFRAIAMSRFGYLGTPLPAVATPQAQADAHACLLDALGIRRAAAVGISAGAPSATQFALRHPERASGLVLLVPLAYLPGREAAEVTALQALMFGLVLRSDFLYWSAMHAAPGIVAGTVLGTPPEVLAAASEHEQRRAREIMRSIMPLGRRQQGLANEARVAATLEPYALERIVAPTLVISLADDLYGTYDSARYTAGRIPGARFIGYPGGGHLWIGHHEDVLREIGSFLRRDAGGGEPGATASSRAGW